MNPKNEPPARKSLASPGRCFSWRELALVAALLLPPALALVQVQAELTNTTENLAGINSAYYEALMGPIFDARLLTRVIVRGTEAVAPLSRAHAHIAWQAMALWLGLLAVYLAARRFAGDPVRALAAPLIAVAWIPWTFLKTGHHASFPYDLPAFLFAAAALLAFLHRAAPMHVALVFVGTLNKETVVWLAAAPLALAVLDRARWKHHVVWGVAACAAFAGAYLLARLPLGAVWTASLEAPVGGAAPRPRWVLNLEELALVGRSGPLQNVWLAWAPLLAGLAFWKKLPRDVKALYVALPVFFAPMFLAGNVNELRLYNDVLPLGAVGVGILIAGWSAEQHRGELLGRQEESPHE